MTVELGVLLFQIASWIYVAAALCYIGYLIAKKDAAGTAGTILLLVGLLFHTGSLVARTVATREPPFLNLYEYTLCMIWSAAVIYLVLQAITKTKVFGSFGVTLIAVAAVSSSYVFSWAVRPVPPALKSIWRTPHIGSASLAYAAFGLAFCLAIMYLIKARAEANPKSFWGARLPALAALDRTVYRLIAFGFLMETFLILTGALWAQKSWARYWGWDNKETWSLITWLVYAAYLHTRSIGWKGRKSAVLAIIGFAVAMFTLFGVSILLSGLHSYA